MYDTWDRPDGSRSPSHMGQRCVSIAGIEAKICARGSPCSWRLARRTQCLGSRKHIENILNSTGYRTSRTVERAVSDSERSVVRREQWSLFNCRLLSYGSKYP